MLTLRQSKNFSVYTTNPSFPHQFSLSASVLLQKRFYLPSDEHATGALSSQSGPVLERVPNEADLFTKMTAMDGSSRDRKRGWAQYTDLQSISVI